MTKKGYKDTFGLMMNRNILEIVALHLSAEGYERFLLRRMVRMELPRQKRKSHT